MKSGHRTACAQAGLTWGEYNRETQAFGLASTGGVVSTTGIAGLTLGGGLGWLMGKHGLSCDNLLSADIVTADGMFLTANATEHPDLFWGLRGGGGNFGIVTSFEYRLYPVGPVLAGMVLYPIASDGVGNISATFVASLVTDTDGLGLSARGGAATEGCERRG